MPVARMKMRPWLEKMIESNTVSGLTWVDKEKTMFSIPWKHAARHGWELNKDANLFKQWAIHTGKYTEGQTSDPKTWKANFRCAMNSLPDVKEVKDKSINKGQQAMRIFKFLPVTPKEKQRKAKHAKLEKKNSEVKLEEDTDYSETASPINSSLMEETLSPQENTVDSTVHTEKPDFTYMSSSEVPDCSLSVEIGTEGFPGNPRFQVSPDHSINYEFHDEIVEICQQLERDSLWNNVNAMELLCSEPCTSPGSLWSDSSSDELDEMPQYTTLGSNFAFCTKDLRFDQKIFSDGL